MLRAGSAKAVVIRRAAVCAAISLCALVTAGTSAAQQGAPGKGPATIDIRTVEEPRYSPRKDPRPWEKPIGQIGLDIQPPSGRLPTDSFAVLVPAASQPPVPAQPTRGCEHVSLNWEPSEIIHQPLYFDDQGLERYGQTVCPLVQPVLSGARFFGTFPIVPYKIGLDRTHDCVSTAGYVREGRCAPPVCERLPLRLDASLLESGAWVGLIFLLP